MFLGNTKDPYYQTIVQRMLAEYEAQGCKISFITLDFSHIDLSVQFFPCFTENLGYTYFTENTVHILLKAWDTQYKVKDGTRQPVILIDVTKENRMSLCQLTTVGCSTEKQKKEIGNIKKKRKSFTRYKSSLKIVYNYYQKQFDKTKSVII